MCALKYYTKQPHKNTMSNAENPRIGTFTKSGGFCGFRTDLVKAFLQERAITKAKMLQCKESEETSRCDKSEIADIIATVSKDSIYKACEMPEN